MAKISTFTRERVYVRPGNVTRLCALANWCATKPRPALRFAQSLVIKDPLHRSTSTGGEDLSFWLRIEDRQ